MKRMIVVYLEPLKSLPVSDDDTRSVVEIPESVVRSLIIPDITLTVYSPFLA